MSLIEETFFFTYANVVVWRVWLWVKILIGIPWAIIASVIYFLIAGLERIYNFIFKK